MARAETEIAQRAGIGGTLLGARSALLQAMHPEVSTGLVLLPGYFERPWPVLLPAAQGPPEPGDPVWGEAGADVRFWGEAVRFDTALVGADLLGHPLTATQQELVYEESVAAAGDELAALPTLREFRVYWDRMLTEVLEPTEAVLAALRPETALPAPAGLRGVVWWALRPLLHGVPVRLACGLLPPEARALLGLDWSAGEERALQALFAALRLAG